MKKKAMETEKSYIKEPSSAHPHIKETNLPEKPSRPESRLNRLKDLVRFYDDYQSMRLRFSNRMKLKKTGKSQVILHGAPNEDTRQLLIPYLKNVRDMEKLAEKEIIDCISDFPIWNEWLVNVKGIAEGLAAHLITEFDIVKADTVSKFWAFAGLTPTSKLIKGEKAKFNKRLRSIVCGRVGSSFLKSKSPYCDYYYKRKADTEAREWGKSKMHRHKDATRIMCKQFLKDFWLAWRKIEGLPVTQAWHGEQPTCLERIA